MAKKPKIKNIPYGLEAAQHFQVRPQGQHVRFQDMETARLYLLEPKTTQALIQALMYAAHHAQEDALHASEPETRRNPPVVMPKKKWGWWRP
jgi:hypothetical protein